MLTGEALQVPNKEPQGEESVERIETDEGDNNIEAHEPNLKIAP